MKCGSGIVLLSGATCMLAAAPALAAYQTRAEVYSSASAGYSPYVSPRPAKDPAGSVVNRDEQGYRSQPTSYAGQSAYNSDSGSTFVDPPGKPGPFVSNWSGSSSSGGEAFASAGVLKARANASAGISERFQQFDYIDDYGNAKAATLYNPYSVGGYTHSYAAWTDDFTVTSNTLAPGTQVTVHMTLTLHSVITGADGDGQASASLLMNGGYAYLSATNYGDQSYIVVERDYILRVGETIEFGVGLDVHASAGAGITSSNMSGVDSESTSVDAYNTSYLKVEVMNPQATLTTASGYQYSTIPEPAALALLGLGAPMLMMRRKK